MAGGDNPVGTIVRGALSTNPAQRAEVPNHCGFGVVLAIGPMVKRVQVGDRVVVAGTSQCGQCYQCLHGRPDYCQFTSFSNAPGVEPFPPFAQLTDGTRVYAQAGIGGMSELMVAFELGKEAAIREIWTPYDAIFFIDQMKAATSAT